MTHRCHDAIEHMIAHARPTRQAFDAFIAQLRALDPVFAEASHQYPDDMGEWQAAVYLLTGCDEVWRALGAAVLAQRSVAPVINELDEPRRAWSGSETSVMRWTAHFWDVNRWPAAFPYSFETFYFRRWITALHLRKSLPPEDSYRR